jgi:hypothetical protein
MAKNDSDPEPQEGADPLLARLERHGELRVARVVSTESKGADGAAYAAPPRALLKGQDTLPPNPAVILDVTDPGSVLVESSTVDTTVDNLSPSSPMNTTISTPLARATRLRNGIVGVAFALATVVIVLVAFRLLRHAQPDADITVTNASASAPTVIAPISATASAASSSSAGSTDVIAASSSTASSSVPATTTASAIPNAPSTATTSQRPHPSADHVRTVPSAASSSLSSRPATTATSAPTASVNSDVNLMHSNLNPNGKSATP